MTKKTVYMLVAVVLVLAAAAEIAGVHMHAASWWPLPFGYDIFFGFVGAWVLIIVSKLIMAPLLQRDKDYYDDEFDEEELSVFCFEMVAFTVMVIMLSPEIQPFKLTIRPEVIC